MTTFSEQFPIVFQALNVGFLQTLKLFAITLIGAIPLGLIIAFGSMSNWAAFGFLRPVVLKHVNPRELTWWQKVQVWFVTDFKPTRHLGRARHAADAPAAGDLLFSGPRLEKQHLGQR